MADPPVKISVAHQGLDALLRALREEEDGKQLRKELAKNMRDVLKPAAVQAKSEIMSMASSGPGVAPALRPTIAKRIRPEVKLGGRWTGARVRARRTPDVRGFKHAPKRTQSAKGWRVRTFGGVIRTQHGKVEWFDHAMQGRDSEYRAAVLEAMEAMARRVASRAK